MAKTNQEALEMIKHWLNTPENGYLGSRYGGRELALASSEGVISDDMNSEFMVKIRKDIPALALTDITVIKSKESIRLSLGSDSAEHDLQEA